MTNEVTTANEAWAEWIFYLASQQETLSPKKAAPYNQIRQLDEFTLAISRDDIDEVYEVTIEGLVAIREHGINFHNTLEDLRPLGLWRNANAYMAVLRLYDQEIPF